MFGLFVICAQKYVIVRKKKTNRLQKQFFIWNKGAFYAKSIFFDVSDRNYCEFKT